MTLPPGPAKTTPVETNNSVLKHTPLYEQHVTLGARMVPFAGYEMPIQYEGITQEHQAVRNAVGVFDVSHMAQLQLTGDNAGAVIDYLITSDATKLVDGQAMYTCACNEAGCVLDDLLVYRVSANHWMIVCNAANHDKIARHVARQARERCAFEDVSDNYALIAVQGPKAMQLLATLGADGSKIAELKPFHFADFDLERIRCMVARTGYTGEDGVELFCPPDKSAHLWQRLLAHGEPLGLKPAGLGCRDTLRLEARLSLYGNDLDETINPLEAGLGWTVKLDAGDFLGRAALAEIKAKGLTRKSVGFEMIGRGIARHGYPLLESEGTPVGVCTSGAPSPTLQKNIGLGFVPPSLSKVGTKLLVDCRGKRVEAVVVKTPFYKRPA